MLRKVKRYISDPYYEIGYDMLAKHPNWMSDKWWISVVWKMSMGNKLDWKNPKTLNEKLQWLKVYDHNPLYTTLVDKIKAKEYVANAIGEQYVIPVLAVYNNIDEIDIDALPEKFVLKCNHDSESVVICRDRAIFDLEAAKRKLDKAQKFNFYLCQREWPYKNVKPLIFAEQYLEMDGNNNESNMCDSHQRIRCAESWGGVFAKNSSKNIDEMVDYKWYCFNGEPKFLYLSQGLEKHETARISFVDLEYKEMPFHRTDFKPFEELPPKPASFKHMIELSKQLSRDIPFVRVDWYEVNKKPIFSELTFYPGGGMTPLIPTEYEYKLGEWLKLPE